MKVEVSERRGRSGKCEWKVKVREGGEVRVNGSREKCEWEECGWVGGWKVRWGWR